MRKPIRYAVVQSGYAVFGVGNTYEAALVDASEWMQNDDGGNMTPTEIDDLLIDGNGVVDGSFHMMDSDHGEFDDYMKNQGCFEKINGEWFSVN